MWITLTKAIVHVCFPRENATTDVNAANIESHKLFDIIDLGDVCFYSLRSGKIVRIVVATEPNAKTRFFWSRQRN